MILIRFLDGSEQEIENADDINQGEVWTTISERRTETNWLGKKVIVGKAFRYVCRTSHIKSIEEIV